MATGFKEDEDRCEGLDCQAARGVTYYVREKKSFCAECADKTGCVRKVRKDELGLFCEKHDKPVRLHCKHHDVAVCHLCATISHTGPPCKLYDVDDAIAIKTNELQNLQKTSKDKVLFWRKFRERLGRCAADAEEKLRSVKESVNTVIDADIAGIYVQEQNETLEINREADAEIKNINEKRRARLDKCHKDADKYRQPIERRRRELLDDVTAVSGKIQVKLAGLQRSAIEVMQAIDEAAMRVGILLEGDKLLLEGAQELVTSLTDTLRKTADEGVVELITNTVRGVRFIEGVRNEKYNGRIGGYEGKWDLCSMVEIPNDIKMPRIFGCTSNDEIILSDVKEGDLNTYCFNVRNNTSQRVVTSDGKTRIISCVLLDEDTIVCGKYREGCTGKNLTGCISLYNRKWELIRDITIPRNTSDDHTWVHAAVDRDGMIIAAEYKQRNIYVISPDDGSIVNTITSIEKIGALRGVLSTRDVIAHPLLFSNKLLIIDRQGARKDVTHSEKISNCCIDPLTDDLYVLYWDEERTTGVNVVQLTGEGYQEKVELGSFRAQANNPLSLHLFLYNSRPVMLPSGDIIVSNGRECLVFNKSFSI